MKKMLSAAALSLSVAGAASAVTWFIPLTGAEEVPPVITQGTGLAKVKYNPNTNFIKITGTFENLNANVTVAHLHGLAAAGATAPPIFGFTVTGTTSGTYFGEATLTDAQETGLFDGLTYINVHSTAHGPGEIRGQVIPAPGAAALLGAAGLIGLRRRR